MKNKFSIIIPIFNKSQQLPFLFTQLNNIAYSDFEIIFIDDGSTDNSLELLNSFKKTSSLIIKILYQKNGGPGSARNTGLKKAEGNYIWFVDSDDLLNTKALEILSSIINKQKFPDILSFNYSISSDFKYNFPLNDSKNITKLTTNKALLFEPVNPWSKIFKRDFLIKNKISFLPYYFGEDLDFTRKSFCAAKSIIKLDTVLYCYINSADSISNTHYNKHSKDFINICKSIYQLSEKFPQFKNEIFYNICEHTRNFISNMNDKSLYSEEILELNDFIVDNSINDNTYEILENQISSKYTSSIRWKITKPFAIIKNTLRTK